MRTILVIYLILTSNLASFAASLSKTQRDQIELCVNAYKSSLEQYCSTKDENLRVNLRSNLMLLFSNPSTNLHIKDYDDLDEDGRLVQPFTEYVRNIEEDYKFKITMEFTKSEVIDCIESLSGQVGVYRLDKKVTVNGFMREVSEIILVSLPKNENENQEYKIVEVLSVENYKGSGPSSVCASNIKVSAESMDLFYRQREANRYYFELRDYSAARKLYEYILLKKPNDKYLINKINTCKDSLTRNDYLTKADLFFGKGEFIQAKTMYERILSLYPTIDHQIILNKVNLAQTSAINAEFDSYLNKGNNALSQSNYTSARYYYEQASNLKPGDKRASESMERAKIQDDKYAISEINRVVSLVTQDQRYIGEYVKVLTKYEGYGNHSRLTGKQYYNLALLFNSYDGSVMKAMKFSRKDCRDYCKIYCKKINDLYFSETDLDTKDKIRHLLVNVINNRNQN